jgi:hypothetical protein
LTELDNFTTTFEKNAGDSGRALGTFDSEKKTLNINLDGIADQVCYDSHTWISNDGVLDDPYLAEYLEHIIVQTMVHETIHAVLFLLFDPKTCTDLDNLTERHWDLKMVI